MGFEEQGAHACYLMQGGQPIAELKSINRALEIVLEEAEAEPLLIGALGALTFSLNIKIPKSWRSGSRKRFIKLLMSYGCSRNDARELASIVQAPVGPKSYQELFFEVMALFAEASTERMHEL